MGRSKNVDIMECLELKCIPSTKIKIYDDYIERQMTTVETAETQTFIMPIWRLRSSFHDALRPIQESAIGSIFSGDKMVLANKAIREGRIDDPNIDYVLTETERCSAMYSKYIQRLKELYNKTKYIFKTISSHKTEILDDYAEFHNYDPFQTRNHYNRIVFVLEMSIVVGESIRDAMHNAYRVMNCAQENLRDMLTCYQTIYTLQQLENLMDNSQENQLEPNVTAGATTFPCLFQNPNDLNLILNSLVIDDDGETEEIDTDIDLHPKNIARIQLPNNYNIKAKGSNIQKQKMQNQNTRSQTKTQQNNNIRIKDSHKKTNNHVDLQPKLVIFAPSNSEHEHELSRRIRISTSPKAGPSNPNKYPSINGDLLISEVEGNKGSKNKFFVNFPKTKLKHSQIHSSQTTRNQQSSLKPVSAERIRITNGPAKAVITTTTTLSVSEKQVSNSKTKPRSRISKQII